MSANRQGKRPRSVALRALLLAAVMWTSGHGQGLPPMGGVKGGVPPPGPDRSDPAPRLSGWKSISVPAPPGP